MNRNIKKETIIAAVAFMATALGFKLADFGFEASGKFIMLISILTGIAFITIGNIKFWFGKEPSDPLKNNSDHSKR
ncbi:hypothetical protein [Halovibrio sp. HP20-50]|uniref:hypothetical protein n=1 Tax=Halovibrio sp. HP20-59 TaxID=3080275 RepID=UPI00294B20C4|nr:hypothetical protein [Halovibrio sp. HP20-59]MEA2119100.1 hypothetical protein [Halovibrio sp. HP20-59]